MVSISQRTHAMQITVFYPNLLLKIRITLYPL